MSSESHLVFVYGTLRRGASNAFRMEGAEFVRSAQVRARLYRVDWYPGIVLDPDADWVKGEIWRLGPEQLAGLDEFEGDEYQRLESPVQATGDDGFFHEWEDKKVSVWIWVWKGSTESLDRVKGGDWLDVEDPE